MYCNSGKYCDRSFQNTLFDIKIYFHKTKLSFVAVTDISTYTCQNIKMSARKNIKNWGIKLKRGKNVWQILYNIVLLTVIYGFVNIILFSNTIYYTLTLLHFQKYLLENNLWFMCFQTHIFVWCNMTKFDLLICYDFSLYIFYFN